MIFIKHDYVKQLPDCVSGGVAGFSDKRFWPFGNPPTADKIGFELGLFFGMLNNRFFCNPLLKLSLRSFLAFWKLGLFIRTIKSSFFL